MLAQTSSMINSATTLSSEVQEQLPEIKPGFIYKGIMACLPSMHYL